MDQKKKYYSMDNIKSDPWWMCTLTNRNLETSRHFIKPNINIYMYMFLYMTFALSRLRPLVVLQPATTTSSKLLTRTSFIVIGYMALWVRQVITSLSFPWYVITHPRRNVIHASGTLKLFSNRFSFSWQAVLFASDLKTACGRSCGKSL